MGCVCGGECVGRLQGCHSIVKLNITCDQKKHTFGKLHHQNGLKFYQSFFISRFTRYLFIGKNGNQI